MRRCGNTGRPKARHLVEGLLIGTTLGASVLSGLVPVTVPLAATVLACALRCSGRNGILRDAGNSVLAASAGCTLRWRLINAFTQCGLRPTSEMTRQRLIVTPNAICDGVAPFSNTQQEAAVTSTQLSGRTLAALAAPALPEGVRVAILWSGLIALIAVRNRAGTKRPAADGDGERG